MDVIVDGQVRSLRAGQVLITRPHEVHAGVGNVLQQSEFLWTQIDSDHLPSEVEKLLADCAERKHYQVRSKTPELMREILGHHREPDAFSRMSVKALHELLIAELARANTPDYRTLSEPVQRCVESFRSSLATPPKFRSMAREIGVSPSYLSKQFHAEIGESPAKWFLHERLDAASKLLVQGASTRKIAGQLGYSSAQNFATTFRREMGMSPTEFRKCAAELERGVALPLNAPLLD